LPIADQIYLSAIGEKAWRRQDGNPDNRDWLLRPGCAFIFAVSVSFGKQPPAGALGRAHGTFGNAKVS